MEEQEPKKSLKQLLGNRRVYAVLVGIGLAGLLFFIIYPGLISTLNEQRSELMQEHARLLRGVNSLPSPQEMNPGIQNSQARFVVEESARQAETATQAADQLRLNLAQRMLSRVTPQSPLANIVRDHGAYTDTAQEVQDDVSQYSKTLNALLRLIEYNPEVDMQDYDSESEETAERLQRLEDGLRETQQELEELPDNSHRDALLDYVDEAAQAHAELVDSADTEAFTQTFTAIQQEVVSGLADYRDELQNNSRNRLIDLVRQS